MQKHGNSSRPPELQLHHPVKTETLNNIRNNLRSS